MNVQALAQFGRETIHSRRANKTLVHRAILPLREHKIPPGFLYHSMKVLTLCFDVLCAVIKLKAGRGHTGRHSPTDICPLSKIVASIFPAASPIPQLSPAIPDPIMTVLVTGTMNCWSFLRLHDQKRYSVIGRKTTANSGWAWELTDDLKPNLRHYCLNFLILKLSQELSP